MSKANSFIYLSSSTRKLTTMVLQLSLSVMTMRKRLLCHAYPTGPDLESSSKRRLTTMILQLSLSPMAMRQRLFYHSHPTGPDQET